MRMATAGDPDILSDFIVPPNVAVDGNLLACVPLLGHPLRLDIIIYI
jgi:hypothetical protein